MQSPCYYQEYEINEETGAKTIYDLREEDITFAGAGI